MKYFLNVGSGSYSRLVPIERDESIKLILFLDFALRVKDSFVACDDSSSVLHASSAFFCFLKIKAFPFVLLLPTTVSSPISSFITV